MPQFIKLYDLRQINFDLGTSIFSSVQLHTKTVIHGNAVSFNMKHSTLPGS